MIRERIVQRRSISLARRVVSRAVLCLLCVFIFSQSSSAQNKIDYEIKNLQFSYRLDTLNLSFHLKISAARCDSIFIYPYRSSKIKHFEYYIGIDPHNIKIYPDTAQKTDVALPSETLEIYFDERLKMPVLVHSKRDTRHVDSVKFQGFFLVCFPKSDGSTVVESLAPVYEWVWLKRQLMWGTYGASFGYHSTDVNEFAGSVQPQGLDYGFRIALDFRYFGALLQFNGSGLKNSDLDWGRMRLYARIPLKSFGQAEHLRLLLGEELDGYTVRKTIDSSVGERNYTTVVGLQYETPSMSLSYDAHFINNGGHSVSLALNSDMRQALESGTRITIDYLKRVQQIRFEWYINFMPDHKYGLRYLDDRPRALMVLAKLASYPFYPVTLIVKLFTSNDKPHLRGILAR